MVGEGDLEFFLFGLAGAFFLSTSLTSGDLALFRLAEEGVGRAGEQGLTFGAAALASSDSSGALLLSSASGDSSGSVFGLINFSPVETGDVSASASSRTFFFPSAGVSSLTPFLLEPVGDE